MKAPRESIIRLESFSFQEWRDSVTIFDIAEVCLDNFNLFIGNNAQGKTKIFRFLFFIKELLTDRRRIIGTRLSAKFKFTVGTGKKQESITYGIEIIPGQGGNKYQETLKNATQLLLSTEKKQLWDEHAGSYLTNFFVPSTVPAISAITGQQFKTIGIIRDFFLRMLFIDAEKFREIFIEPNALVINNFGTNLASVLLNWQKKYPETYGEVIEEFKDYFPIIKEVGFKDTVVNAGLNVGQKTQLLSIKEEGIFEDIFQIDWSAGMWRVLCLICLPKSQFEFNGEFYPPSSIFIDEIENGLDFKRLGEVTDYLKVYSDYMQVIVSSHSPLMARFVHPKNWQIVRRKKEKIKVTKLTIDPNLEDKLELYKQEYWDFYEDYVSNASIYEPD